VIIKKSKLTLQLIFFFFSMIALFFYNYHENFYFGDAINYINADSKYYLELSQKVQNINDMIIMFLGNKNLLGQLVYYDLILQKSRIAFFLVNIIFLYYLFNKLYKNLAGQPNKNLILFLLLINPAIIASLSGPNKEITAFISIIFIINYILEKRLRYLFFALIFAFFTRFEMILVILGFLFFKRYKKKRQYILFSLLILATTLVIYFSPNYGFQIFTVFNKRDGSLGIVYEMAELNKMGLYLITFMPKLVLDLFGEVLVLNPLLLQGQSLFIYLSQIQFLFLIAVIIKRKKMTLENKFFLFLLLYSIMFTIPAFIQHRYFVPIYSILIFLAFYKIPYNKNK